MENKVRKIQIILIVFSMSIGIVKSQSLTFFSFEFNRGVRSALKLAEDADITAQTADTVTVLNLSGTGITDIRDIIYFPKIRVLNLSNNYIQNISPLVNLPLLADLDISNNALQNIDILIFTLSKKMIVNASLNFISDFSMITGDYHCNFTLIGEGMQRDPNGFQFVIGAFYSDVDKDGKSFIVYSVKANEGSPVQLNYSGKAVSVNADNFLHEYHFVDNLIQTEQITLSLNNRGDATYIVPASAQSIKAGTQGSFRTMLPQDYTIRVYKSKNPDAVQVDNTTILYNAPDNFVSDTLYYEFRLDDRLKGYSRIYLKESVTGVPDISVPAVEIYPNPTADKFVLYVPCKENEQLQVSIYDMNGQKIEEQIISGNSTVFNINNYKQGVYFVRIVAQSGQSVTKKLIKK